MIQNKAAGPSSSGQSGSLDDLLLRETYHRCSNDLQLVISLLSLQSRRAVNSETRDALADAMARVAILARARTELTQRRPPSLEGALQEVCTVLLSQAEPRSILISMQIEYEVHGLPPEHIATLALVVNELATNAVKHAFEEGKAGHIRIAVRRYDQHHAAITVDDDGIPFPVPRGEKSAGIGLSLVKRLVASANGVFIQHAAESKCFEIRVPVNGTLDQTRRATALRS
ncbi:Two-component sensor histidine kinase, contains HisKA and HATPase domains [Rhizobium sp. NFR07]|uniref:sensor histidine kinase n=1 Tax=Rhizobium sp. NFR07 TaxID=1566262 RepID=UPI0008EEE2BD|nr:sensor histidine kinase [Rhizobium sp. NFR07]SFB63679.1 Two-component sensor histidine kinase, contains HisKA and HATPase domains [Rhizobium sp. NFR07]